MAIGANSSAYKPARMAISCAVTWMRASDTTGSGLLVESGLSVRFFLASAKGIAFLHG
jgi:hypothetical protein